MKVLDYQLSEELYQYLLMQPRYKVIRLRRRNLLRTIVSGFIAEQNGIWQSSELKSSRTEACASLQPIPLEEFRKHFEYISFLQRHYAEVVERKPSSDRLFLDYEDLYTDNLSQNRSTLQRVFHFLGLELPDSPELNHHLDPTHARINNSDTYALLPNANEIERQFGSDQTGWLFK
jgi:hypothetical protein